MQSKSDSPNDELIRLLRATATGDAVAFQSLYDMTSARLFAVAQTMMQDVSLAEDVLQEAFVQVWHGAGSYHAERGGVLTWLTTLVRYRAIDLLRKRQRGGGSGGSGFSADANLSTSQGIVDLADETQAGPLANAIAGEDSVNLHDCVDRLSDSQQKSVALAFFRGFTHQELADCLAKPLGTIKSRLRRSLLRLRDCLETLSDDNEIQRSTR